jgi:hypothetical protein
LVIGTTVDDLAWELVDERNLDDPGLKKNSDDS